MVGWINNVVHADNGILLSLEKGGILTPAATPMAPDDIVLSDTSESQRDKCWAIPLTRGHRVVQFIETGAGDGCWQGGRGAVVLWYRVSV